MLFSSEGEMLFNYRGCFWARCEDFAFVGVVGFFFFFPPPHFCPLLDSTLIFTTWKNNKRQMVLSSFQRGTVRSGETKGLISHEGY